MGSARGSRIVAWLVLAACSGKSEGGATDAGTPDATDAGRTKQTEGVVCGAPDAGVPNCSGATPVCCHALHVCVATADACHTMGDYGAMTCDEAGDCNEGEVCCAEYYKPGFTGASCTASCGAPPYSVELLCGGPTSTDCGPGKTCQPDAQLPPYYSCP